MSRGQWAVQRERFQLDAFERQLPDQPSRALGEAIQDALKDLGLHRDHTLHRLGEQWPDLAGAQVARHARPGAMQGHMLVVYVDHPMWLTELQRGADQSLLANLHRAGFGMIKRVRFQIDPELGR